MKIYTLCGRDEPARFLSEDELAQVWQASLPQPA